MPLFLSLAYSVKYLRGLKCIKALTIFIWTFMGGRICGWEKGCLMKMWAVWKMQFLIISNWILRKQKRYLLQNLLLDPAS